MSALAKIFIVMNLALGLLFCSVSATLFMTRQDFEGMRAKEKAAYKRDSTRLIDLLEGQKTELARVHKMLTGLVNNVDQLGVAMKTATEEYDAQKGQSSTFESQRSAAAEGTETQVGLQKTQRVAIQSKAGELESSSENYATALLEVSQADAERNRMIRDRLHVGRESEELATEIALLTERTSKLGTSVASAEKMLGIENERDLVEGVKISARVVDVDEGLAAVILDAGSQDKVHMGQELVITRGKQYVGRVKVVKLRDRQCGAKVLTEKRKIQAGDTAISNAGI